MIDSFIDWLTNSGDSWVHIWKAMNYNYLIKNQVYVLNKEPLLHPRCVFTASRDNLVLSYTLASTSISSDWKWVCTGEKNFTKASTLSLSLARSLTRSLFPSLTHTHGRPVATGHSFRQTDDEWQKAGGRGERWRDRSPVREKWQYFRYT